MPLELSKPFYDPIIKNVMILWTLLKIFMNTKKYALSHWCMVGQYVAYDVDDGSPGHDEVMRCMCLYSVPPGIETERLCQLEAVFLEPPHDLHRTPFQQNLTISSDRQTSCKFLDFNIKWYICQENVGKHKDILEGQVLENFITVVWILQEV